MVLNHNSLDLINEVQGAAPGDKGPAFTRNRPSLSTMIKSDLDQLTRRILLINVASSTLIPLLTSSLGTEITNFTGRPNTIFRNNSAVNTAMEFAMGWYGKSWLENSLARVVRRLVIERVSIEVDLARLERRPGGNGSGREGTSGPVDVARELEANVKALVYWCEQIWGSIVNARGDCPKCVGDISGG